MWVLVFDTFPKKYFSHPVMLPLWCEEALKKFSTAAGVFRPKILASWYPNTGFNIRSWILIEMLNCVHEDEISFFLGEPPLKKMSQKVGQVNNSQ